MKHIERYLSAYVIHCLFGSDKNAHMEYVLQTLRESASKTNHPILSKVLDYIRQGDPEDPQTMGEIRDYVSDLIKSGAQPQISPYKAMISFKKGFMIVVVSDETNILSIGCAREADKEQALEELRQTFPGIEFTNT